MLFFQNSKIRHWCTSVTVFKVWRLRIQVSKDQGTGTLGTNGDTVFPLWNTAWEFLVSYFEILTLNWFQTCIKVARIIQRTHTIFPLNSPVVNTGQYTYHSLPIYIFLITLEQIACLTFCYPLILQWDFLDKEDISTCLCHHRHHIVLWVPSEWKHHPQAQEPLRNKLKVTDSHAPPQ